MAPKKSKPGSGPEEQRIIDLGHPECNPPFADNSIKTSRFTLLSFFPLVRVAFSFSLKFVTWTEYVQNFASNRGFVYYLPFPTKLFHVLLIALFSF